MLWFGVGMQDETFATAGASHLVEHLVLAEQPRSHLDLDGTVDVATTCFSATGRPAEVAAFLTRLCASLADLPTHRLALEAAVIDVEGGVGADPTMAAAWTARFGIQGPGMVSVRGHGPGSITAETVREHARRWFTAPTAALAVVGPWPEGVTLPLAAGSRPPRWVREPAGGDGPTWVSAPSPGVGLLLDRPDPHDGAGAVALTVLAERLIDVVRHRLALSCSVGSDVLTVGDGDVMTLALDAAEGRAGDVAAVVWEQLGDLADHGPAPQELAHVLAGYAAETDAGDDDDDEDVARAEPVRAAGTTVLGARLRPLDEIAAGVTAVTADQVRGFLARARTTALLVVPDDQRLPEAVEGIRERPWCAVADALPEGRAHRGPLLARAPSRDARQRLVVGERALGLRHADGETCTIAWDEVAGAIPFMDDGVMVMGVDRCSIPVHPDSYGRSVFDAVCARLGHHLEDLHRARAATGARR